MRRTLRALAKPWRGALVASALLVAFAPALHAADAHGVVAGTVTDAQAGRALPGAPVRIEGTQLESVTDLQGRFRITGVPDGEHALTVTYLGFEAAAQPVSVVNGTPTTVEVKLRLRGFAETVTVQAPILRGQAKALNPDLLT